MKRPKANLSRFKSISVTVTTTTTTLEAMEQKGDLLIRDLWQNGTGSVHDMRIVNTDAKYHLAKTLEKCLQEVERA